MNDLFVLHLSGDDELASELADGLDAIGVSHRVVASLARNTMKTLYVSAIPHLFP